MDHGNKAMRPSAIKRLHFWPLALLFLLPNILSAQEAYRHAQEPIGTVREIYDGALFPDIQVNTFRNIDRLFPTRTVKHGKHIYPLPPGDTPLKNFRFESRGKRYDLYDFLSLNRVSGIIVIKDDQVAFEKYFLGNDETTRWMSMSVVKSITATMVGMAIRDKYIASLDDPVTKYVKELEGSAYQGVTVRQLLHMASGVEWNETYTDPASDRRAMLEAQIAQEPGGILEVMGALGRAAEPGTRWNYSTGETQIAAELLAAATGRKLSDYLSEKLWAPFGMEADANWWLESPDGLEIGGSGLSATLRDYARFGLFLLHEGKIDGTQTLPDGWIEEASRPQIIDGAPVDYGFMVLPHDDGAYAAIGIFGQFVVVQPKNNMVIAMWSAQPKPEGMDAIDEYVFFTALAKALN
jgi:CubicO group peptidase (beta-lactamase class C family)